LQKIIKKFWSPKKGRKLVENLRGFKFTPTVLFHEFVRQLEEMYIVIKEEKYICNLKIINIRTLKYLIAIMCPWQVFVSKIHRPLIKSFRQLVGLFFFIVAICI
jgi:hypothetical protein